MDLPWLETLRIREFWDNPDVLHIASNLKPDEQAIPRASLEAWIAGGFTRIEGSHNKEYSDTFYARPIPPPVPPQRDATILDGSSDPVLLSYPWLVTKSTIFRQVNHHWLPQGLIPSEGRLLAFDYPHLILGTPHAHAGRGKVSIFDLNQPLNAAPIDIVIPGASTDLRFGFSASLSNNTLAIGTDTLRSTLFLFEYTGGAWAEAVRWPHYTRFSLQGDWLAATQGTPAISIFHRTPSGWLITQSLPCPAPPMALTLDGDNLIALFEQHFQHFHHRDGNWSLAATVELPGPARKCTLSGNLCAIGECGRFSATGAVHIFRRHNQTWQHEETLVRPNGRPGDDFGSALALDHNHLAVGPGPLQIFHLDMLEP